MDHTVNAFVIFSPETAYSNSAAGHVAKT